MFAVIKTGGKQYKVRVGETIDVEKLDIAEGARIRLDEVLLAATDSNVAYGRPLIDGAVVMADVVRQGKGPKLIVFKYKSKSRYRRRTGHRQRQTSLTIRSIEVPGWEPERAEEAPRSVEAGRAPVAETSSAPSVAAAEASAVENAAAAEASAVENAAAAGASSTGSIASPEAGGGGSAAVAEADTASMENAESAETGGTESATGE